MEKYEFHERACTLLHHTFFPRRSRFHRIYVHSSCMMLLCGGDAEVVGGGGWAVGGCGHGGAEDGVDVAGVLHYIHALLVDSSFAVDFDVDVYVDVVAVVGAGTAVDVVLDVDNVDVAVELVSPCYTPLALPSCPVDSLLHW